MMIYCPTCETACSESAATCPSCGHRLAANLSDDEITKLAEASKRAKDDENVAVGPDSFRLDTLPKPFNDSFGRTPAHSGSPAPRYIGIRFVALLLIIAGCIDVLFGIVGIVQNARSDQVGVGDVFLFFWSFVTIVSGLIIIGIAQMFSAFRDMAINSYVLVARSAK